MTNNSYPPVQYVRDLPTLKGLSDGISLGTIALMGVCIWLGYFIAKKSK